jgi:hypothetical protein
MANYSQAQKQQYRLHDDYDDDNNNNNDDGIFQVTSLISLQYSEVYNYVGWTCFSSYTEN